MFLDFRLDRVRYRWGAFCLAAAIENRGVGLRHGRGDGNPRNSEKNALASTDNTVGPEGAWRFSLRKLSGEPGFYVSLLNCP